jgi:hypothetical protein
VLQFFGGAMLWKSGSRLNALTLFAVAAGMAAMSILLWRVGKRREQELWTDLHIGHAKDVSQRQTD